MESCVLPPGDLWTHPASGHLAHLRRKAAHRCATPYLTRSILQHSLQCASVVPMNEPGNPHVDAKKSKGQGRETGPGLDGILEEIEQEGHQYHADRGSNGQESRRKTTHSFSGVMGPELAPYPFGVVIVMVRTHGCSCSCSRVLPSESRGRFAATARPRIARTRNVDSARYGGRSTRRL